jgi:histidyl-tRNA synthetase
MRAFIQNGMHTLPKPIKLYAIGPIFRYERPQAGSYRQHTQFNIEALGEQDPAVDVEVMELCRHLYADLGFGNLAFQINSTGCPQCKPGYVSLLVDYYRNQEEEICEDCKRRMVLNPLRMLDCKEVQCQPLIARAPHFIDHLCPECATHFDTLQSHLKTLNRPFTISHRLVRGLDYYTKTVFEVWAPDIGAQTAVCGGGRYDGLIELLGGPSTPVIGFGSGIERIILTMKAQGVAVPELPAPQVMIASLGSEAKTVAVRLLADLRASGLAAVLSFGDRSLRAQFRAAGKQQIRYVIILGRDELEQNRAAIRDMRSHEQIEVPLDGLIVWLKEQLSS